MEGRTRLPAFRGDLAGGWAPDLAPSSQPGEGRGTGQGQAVPGRSSTRGRTCLDRVHKANLDGGKGFEQAEGPWHAVTPWGRRRRAVAVTWTELLGPSPPRGSVSRWLR